jgi:hypothetical protein
VVVVVEVVVTFIEVGLVVTAGVVVEAVLAFEDVMAVVTVDLEQDERTSDNTMRQVSSVQIAPLFMRASYYLMEDVWEIDCDLIFKVFFLRTNHFNKGA